MFIWIPSLVFHQDFLQLIQFFIYLFFFKLSCHTKHEISIVRRPLQSLFLCISKNLDRLDMCFVSVSSWNLNQPIFILRPLNITILRHTPEQAVAEAVLQQLEPLEPLFLGWKSLRSFVKQYTSHMPEETDFVPISPKESQIFCRTHLALCFDCSSFKGITGVLAQCFKIETAHFTNCKYDFHLTNNF